MPDLPRADRIRYEEAAADLRLHYQTTGTCDMVEVKMRLEHLNPFLAGRKLASTAGPTRPRTSRIGRQRAWRQH